MFEGLSPQARDAKSWPFEQARLVLARLMTGLEFDSQRDLAMTLINAGNQVLSSTAASNVTTEASVLNFGASGGGMSFFV